MLASLCHDLGKPATTEFVPIGNICRWRALGHEEAGVGPTAAMLARLNVYTIDGYDVASQVLALVGNHLVPHAFFKLDPGNAAFRRLARRVDLLLLARVARADGEGRYPRIYNPAAVGWFLDRVAKLDLREGPPPSLLMGRHLLALGMKPGPNVGKVIKEVYEQQTEGLIASEAEAIESGKLLATAWGLL
jgi:tRNA nucleotidyltransferase (CCA-adding enzyme)